VGRFARKVRRQALVVLATLALAASVAAARASAEAGQIRVFDISCVGGSPISTSAIQSDLAMLDQWLAARTKSPSHTNGEVWNWVLDATGAPLVVPVDLPSVVTSGGLDLPASCVDFKSRGILTTYANFDRLILPALGYADTQEKYLIFLDTTLADGCAETLVPGTFGQPFHSVIRMLDGGCVSPTTPGLPIGDASTLVGLLLQLQVPGPPTDPADILNLGLSWPGYSLPLDKLHLDASGTVYRDYLATQPYLKDAPTPKFPLQLTVSGKGAVRAAGVACVDAATVSKTCTTQQLQGQRLALQATPAKGWRFVGWQGACHGTLARCSLQVAAPVRVTATFKRKLPVAHAPKKKTTKKPKKTKKRG
jgi:hypothetical protein